VLEDIEQALHVLADLISETSGCGRSASSFTTDPKEHRAILFVPELIVDEISLLISACVILVEMINFICEIVGLEVFYVKLLIDSFLSHSLDGRQKPHN
jgi:hypothetical protein